MILSATFSKPVKNVEAILGKPYTRIKIKRHAASSGKAYFAEKFTATQAFQEYYTEEEFGDFLKAHAGTTFKNCVERTETEIITILGNKNGKTTTLRKSIENVPPKRFGSNCGDTECGGAGCENSCAGQSSARGHNRTKSYLIPEGKPAPFFVLLGVMTAEGKVVASKYDKFRQINRFLEFIDDIIPAVMRAAGTSRPLRIIDFGSGKSYLTFALHYYLKEIKKIDALITGLDLKKDVVAYCNKTAAALGAEGLDFAAGDIASYADGDKADIIITLHACDTATDYALAYAVNCGCKAILSVPCCQHELNAALDKNTADAAFAPLLKYGIIKERFAALATDALRAEYLEKAGYDVKLLEFIALEHTPKNILIRAVKREAGDGKAKASAAEAEARASGEAKALTDALGAEPVLRKLLQETGAAEQETKH
ncbi:SAM-dependent methyltransferase [Treponema socranskii]|uniref:class I SAM-dependent methyltransferase n=1 Tax=Treponema socranskii TaxID=53419 RepID=UPI0028E6C268|nr:SAM-dependent methyltransferase [Treponema socranskii]